MASLTLEQAIRNRPSARKGNKDEFNQFYFSAEAKRIRKTHVGTLRKIWTPKALRWIEHEGSTVLYATRKSYVHAAKRAFMHAALYGLIGFIGFIGFIGLGISPVAAIPFGIAGALTVARLGYSMYMIDRVMRKDMQGFKVIKEIPTDSPTKPARPNLLAAVLGRYRRVPG